MVFTAILVAVAGYLGITMPSPTTAVAAIISVITAVVANLHANNTVQTAVISAVNQAVSTVPVVTTTPGTAPVPAGTAASVFNPGFTVTPVQTNIKSGGAAILQIQTGTATKTLIVDPLDGSGPQNVPLVAGAATFNHVYTFVATQHYTGHTFFPKFTIMDAAGDTLTFNDVANGQGACCWVIVSA
jgi:hypothetical protein